jgi:hypothetical protein
MLGIFNRPRAGGGRMGKLACALVLVAALASFAFASSATATPKGVFSVFSDCPTENPNVGLCVYGLTTSGEFVLGTSKVPINQTVTLQGGAVWTGNEENLKEYDLIPPKDGKILSETALNVPGGLAGLINCEEIKGSGLLEIGARALCKEVFENGATGVTAQTEPVNTTSNPIVLNLVNLALEEGVAVKLPVRVHLKNPLLGSSCYVGSSAHPVQLNLTTGTTSPPPPNKPISGKRGEAETLERNEQFMLRLFENSLVDNSFSAPAAEGCGGLFALVIDPIIDAKIGLPSPSGKNTAILNGELKTATPEAVLANET